jgi:Cdc6-like AAA superfamily ATPase
MDYSDTFKKREIKMSKDNLNSNPYRPFDLESGRWFRNEDLIKNVKQTLDKMKEDRVIILEGDPGSGKTSTLKQIEASSALIGENYVPLYLDSRKYIKHDLEGLFSVVYKDILAKLNNAGYPVEKTDIFRRLPMEENSIESFLLKIESTLAGKRTFLLILDEFDLLLEGIKIDLISDMIKKFQDIEKNWGNYVLILAGNKKRFVRFRLGIFDKFFKNAFYIRVEQTLDEKRIRKLIVEPEKGKKLPYNYNEEAVKKIIELSGQNIYFQQLICYYLFNLMAEEKQEVCSDHHVEQAVQRILKDKRPEFTYAWENLIYKESRLLASALADESMIIQEVDLYRFKENNLLTDIFGKNLQEELKKHEDFGYIKPMSQGRFKGFPFIIPLLGRWVHQEQPFMKIVIQHIDDIADKISLDRLIEGIEITPASKLIPFDKFTILSILKKWKLLCDAVSKNKTTIDQQYIEDFFSVFSRMLNLNIHVESESYLTYFLIDISDLSIGLLEKAYCFIQDRPEIRQKDIDNIENFSIGLASEAQKKIPILFYFHKTKPVANLLNKPYLNIIGIESNDIKKITLANTPLEAFKNTLLSKLSLTKVSPYRTTGPERRIFYGRNAVIHQISAASNTSYAVVGARKIGKSSLLHKLKDNPPPNTIYIFMDLEVEFHNVTDYKTFMRSLELELGRQFKKKIKLGGIFSKKKLSRLPEIIRNLSEDNNTIIFILDEIDSLLELDHRNDYKLMHIFRKMSQENLCQFIFTGFKKLYHQKRDHESPSYNFYEEIRLEPLEEEAAKDLITEPMKSIGIRYNDPDDRKLILEYTACHPALLQFFCKQLVKKVEKHKKGVQRTIYREDIEELFDDTYEEYIFDDVYMFFSDLSDLDRLILMVMAVDKSSAKVFSLHDIENKLFRNGLKLPIEKIHNSLKNLVMRFILLDAGRDQYKFALPGFPWMLKRRVGDDFKNKTIREIKENESQSF